MKRVLSLSLLVQVAVSILPEAAFAQATIVVTASPSVESLPVARTTPTFTLRWQLVKNPPLTAPIFSPSGAFATPGGLPLGTNATTLIDSGPIPAGVPSTSTVLERLRIPPNVIRNAQAAGATTIVYTRTFEDSFKGAGAGRLPPISVAPPGTGLVPVTGAGTVRFQLVGGLGGPFEVSFFRLHFENDSALQVVEPDAPLHAIADVSYSGAGVIDAVWEVSDSGLSRTAGAVTSFRRLRRERRRLDPSGRAHIRSPALPTGKAGLHLVRLRFVSPDTALELPTIRYFVLGGNVPGMGLAPLPLALGTPLDLAALTETTQFSWEPVSGTSAYQVEFFAAHEVQANEYPPDAVLEPSEDRQVILSEDPLPDELVTGVVVRPEQSRITLPPYVRQQLAAGQQYSWRVRALMADGSVLAESPSRQVRVPVSLSEDPTSGP